jgi:hypothetical protein
MADAATRLGQAKLFCGVKDLGVEINCLLGIFDTLGRDTSHEPS